MKRLYSRVPAAAVKQEVDGHRYAWIPYRYDGQRVTEDFDHPWMARVTIPPCYIKNGEAYVHFATVGDASTPAYLPFGVTAEDI